MKFELLRPNALLPTRGTSLSSGLDLSVPIDEGARLSSGETRVIMVGVAVEIAAGFEGQIRGRSSLSKRGVLCHLGTIDRDYRGELGVTLTNLSNGPVELKHGSRIAQLVFCPVLLDDAEEGVVDASTERGTRGFGSTDK